MRFTESRIRRSIIALLVLVAVTIETVPANAQKKQPLPIYRSPHFHIRSDMPADKAKELLQQLEVMLRGVSAYWGVTQRKVIECNVVDKQSNWRGRGFDESALKQTENGAGVTKSQTRRVGGRIFSQSIVWSSAHTNTTLHESVHAYCQMNFGTTGPTWYAEGMAEIGHFWKEDDPTVNVPPYVLRYIKSTTPPTLAKLTDRNQRTGDSVENYAWRWALCYMLANNPNYSDRFRVLGLGLLTKQRNTSFPRVFGSVLEELEFEFRFFLKHVDVGFHAGLAAWNWKAKFKAVKRQATLKSKIKAKAGWQPSLLRVTEGQAYDYTAEGQWRTADEQEWLNADGTKNQLGQLVGTILQDGELVGKINLGTSGTFTAPHSGNLYLRCRDKWTSLSDNDGTLRVTLKNSATPIRSDRVGEKESSN